MLPSMPLEVAVRRFSHPVEGCTRFLIPILTVAVFGACERAGLLDPPVPVPQAHATTLTVVVKQPAASQLAGGVKALIESCVGERLTIVGDALLVFHLTMLPDGSQLVVRHRNPTGAFGLGEDTGTRYRIGASDQFISFVAPSGGYTETFKANLTVTGPRLLFTFPILIHVTVTPLGDLKAEIEVIGPPSCSS